MTSLALRRMTILALAAPLALGLTSCKQQADPAATKSTESVAKIAAPAGKAWAEVFAVTPEGGFQMGNPNAPIKLIEFGALSCSHCADFAVKGFPKLRDEYVQSGRLSFEFRPFMLNLLDLPATLLATCGSPEAVIPLSEQFWAFQPTMFENLQKAGDAQVQAAGALTPDKRFAAIARLGGMDSFFASRGIAAEQGAACLADSAKATKLVAQTQASGEKYGITGTPTFYLNGANVGTLTWETLEPLLQNAGAR